MNELMEMLTSIGNRLDNLEAELRSRDKDNAKWLGDLDNRLLALENRLTALEKNTADPTPDPACEGCAEDDCQLRDKPPHWSEIADDDEPICYVSPPTCGECKRPWRKDDHEDFPCFDHPACAPSNYERPSWRLEDSPACSNFKRKEA